MRNEINIGERCKCCAGVISNDNYMDVIHDIIYNEMLHHPNNTGYENRWNITKDVVSEIVEFIEECKRLHKIIKMYRNARDISFYQFYGMFIVGVSEIKNYDFHTDMLAKISDSFNKKGILSVIFDMYSPDKITVDVNIIKSIEIEKKLFDSYVINESELCILVTKVFDKLTNYELFKEDIYVD